MQNNFKIYRTDLATDKINNEKIIKNYKKYNIKIGEYKKYKYIYRIIHFNSLIHSNKIKNIIKKELTYFLDKYSIDKDSHVFIIGLGNESNTADSIGPKTIKYITANSHLENIIELNNTKISLLEPGVLGNTGIDTMKIIKSISNNIKPDLIILIDSYITSNINNLNKTIEINDNGIIPGSGIHGNNSKINKKTMNTNILVFGIPTSLEYKNDSITLLMSTSDIDKYVYDISNIIGNAINEILYSR